MSIHIHDEIVRNEMRTTSIPPPHEPSLPPVSPAQESSAPATSGAPPRSWLRRVVPQILVFGCLGAAAFWGHHSGWRLSAAMPFGGQAEPVAALWCEEHSVPEEDCVECNPELLPRGASHGWCKEHGVHDCPLCFPDVVQLNKPPEFTAADRQRASRALALGERPRNNSKCQLYLRRVQFASAEAAEKAGVEVEPAWRAPIVEAISANGSLSYDETRSAHLSSRRAGTVWRVEKQLGDRVAKGEVLALVDAAEAGRAKADFLQALTQADLKRQNYSFQQSAADALPARQLRESASALREAEIRLVTAQQALVNLGLPIDVEDFEDLETADVVRRVQFLGLPANLIESLDPKTTSTNLLPIVSPLDGVVVSRDVVAGEVVDAAKLLFAVADVERMWLTLDVRLEDADRVAAGQKVRFHPDGGKQAAEGRINWISTAVDQKTRTVKVRAEIDNTNGAWKAGTFGVGEIVLREESDAIVVPNEAVQWEGDCYVVFVRDKNYLQEGAPKLFHVRNVRLGAKDERYTEIIAGVAPYELVATAGSSILGAELLKSSLGAGCTCHQ
ncbi:MAG TPA: efflux RND transporter periplasmic adaptor subunit [Pirellulales bacterium]|nr:efflux RND transporter periplasmic adaptor subunit [Pirellulales bacterium]